MGLRTLSLSVLGTLVLAGCGSQPTMSLDGSGQGSGGSAPLSEAGSADSSVKESSTIIPLSDDAQSQTCVPKTCEELGVNCGPVTDLTCGGIITCGTCGAGEICGATAPNVCGKGSTTDADTTVCEPQSCADQGLDCGQVSDGCGNIIQCGTCASPKICGGSGTPGTCGCTGVCAKIPDCDSGKTTTLTGKVYDPAGNNPLYHVLVYIPNDPTDPALNSFSQGITCDQCGATAAGSPLVTAYTAPDGTFTLTNVPVGDDLTLVIQLGRWRRKFTVSIANACDANTVTDKTLRMPSDHTQGDIPLIAMVTGRYDNMECVLRKAGIADSEFTNPDGAGRVRFYRGGTGTESTNDADQGLRGGASLAVGGGAATPRETALFATQDGGTPVLNNYDMVIFACTGHADTDKKTTAELDTLRSYAENGGRVFATHFSYSWLSTNGNFAQAANWDDNGDDRVNDGGVPGYIDTQSNPKGSDFQKWLEVTDVSKPDSGIVDLLAVRHDTLGVIAPTQQWLWRNRIDTGAGTGSIPAHFTFNTPVGATAAHQCGRVLFSDFHVTDAKTDDGTVFPSECDSKPMTAQEKLFEFMIFDLGSCVEPYTPQCTPISCTSQGIECGPTGDGCGNLLQCGDCPPGEYCGGGGPGKCGSTVKCTPNSCAGQKIECGPAGDGCGNLLQCGDCNTGYVCGLYEAGHCGKPTIY